MTREKQVRLLDKEADKLLKILEKKGKAKWLKRWKEHMAFPSNIAPLSAKREEQEKSWWENRQNGKGKHNNIGG